MTLCDPSRTSANYKRWRLDWVAEAERTRRAAIHHTPHEPKHVSLIWQLKHGCIPTANQLQHMSPENRKDLAHYFY
ncbi:hypothetical protein H4R19_000426, partial [Coemansia spiralis]